jgi:hypothetical protein
MLYFPPTPPSSSLEHRAHFKPPVDFTLLVLSGASGAGAACFGTDFFFSSSRAAVTVLDR